jgi:hypothetical protein
MNSGPILAQIRHLTSLSAFDSSDIDQDPFSIKRPQQEPAEQNRQCGIEERGICGVHSQPEQLKIRVG